MDTLPHPRIAIIEDNEDLREEVLFYLQHKGFPIWGAPSAEAFWKKLHFHPVDIVLVDLGLPEEDGFSVVEHLRKLYNYGLVIITARGGQQERLRGLDLGADLFLVKPINFVQLSNTLIRLGQRLQANPSDANIAPNKPNKTNWRLEKATSQLIAPDDQAIQLTPKEFELLNILIDSTNQIFDRWILHDLLFKYSEEPDVHRIDVILSRLRRKAKQHNMSLPLRSIFGKGVTFVMD